MSSAIHPLPLRADFYILPGTGEEERIAFLGKLVDKIREAGQSIHIRAASPAQASAIDDHLWRYRADSFLPHGLESDFPDLPVVISHIPGADRSFDVLINLSGSLPEDLTRFQRYTEVANQDGPVIQVARQHFKHFKAQGVEPHFHDLGKR